MVKIQIALATMGICGIGTVGQPKWIKVIEMVESPKVKRKITPKIDKRSNSKGLGNFLSIQLF
jgi:hypothetical protein